MYNYVLSICIFLQSSLALSQRDVVLENFSATEDLGKYESFSLQNMQNLAPENNSVIAVQAGANNVGNVYVKSSKALVNVIQRGSNNIVDLAYDVQQIQTTILQEGTNNMVVDYVFSESDAVNTFITQKGHNLSVQKFGANAITNGLQINMTGANKTIIVNSFK